MGSMAVVVSSWDPEVAKSSRDSSNVDVLPLGLVIYTINKQW